MSRSRGYNTLNTQNIMPYFTVVAALELKYDLFIIGIHHANRLK